MLLLILLTISAGVIYLFFLINGRRNENYWKKRGVKFCKKNKNFGMFWDWITQPNRPNLETISDIYNEFKGEPAVGIATLTIPGLLVTDPINSQHVLENDFESFHFRGLTFNENDFIGHYSIPFIQGEKWKLLRQSISTLFTTTKLKNMFYTIDDITREFVEHLKEKPKCKESTFLRTKQLSAAVLSSTLLGIKSEPTFDTPLVKQIKSLKPEAFETHLKVAIAMTLPDISKVLGIKFFRKVEHFFMSALRVFVENTVKTEDQKSSARYFAEIYRNNKKKKLQRNDDNGFEFEFSDEVLAANIFFMLTGGTEGAALGIFGAMFMLAKYPNIQEKLQHEINNAYNKCNGELTYDVIMEMPYLDKVMNESFRVFPVMSIILRKCMKDTVLPIGDIQIDKGTLMVIPVYAHHHDPDYFPNPEVFDPERFSDPSLANSSIFKPMGRGPRMCIGARLGRLQVKVGLFHIVKNFKLMLIPGQEEVKIRRNVLITDLNDSSLILRSR